MTKRVHLSLYNPNPPLKKRVIIKKANRIPIMMFMERVLVMMQRENILLEKNHWIHGILIKLNNKLSRCPGLNKFWVFLYYTNPPELVFFITLFHQQSHSSP